MSYETQNLCNCGPACSCSPCRCGEGTETIAAKAVCGCGPGCECGSCGCGC